MDDPGPAATVDRAGVISAANAAPSQQPTDSSDEAGFMHTSLSPPSLNSHSTQRQGVREDRATAAIVSRLEK